LLTGASQTIGKRLCGRLVRTSVAPEYVPKHNSELSGNRGRRPDDAVRLEIGESQVRTAAATETCFGLDALLLQSLIGGARATTR
jgi:hypothetical protein